MTADAKVSASFEFSRRVFDLTVSAPVLGSLFGRAAGLPAVQAAGTQLLSLASPWTPQLEKLDAMAASTLDSVTACVSAKVAASSTLGRSALSSVVDLAVLPTMTELYLSPIDCSLRTAEKLLPAEPATETAPIAASEPAPVSAAKAYPRRALDISRRATKALKAAALDKLSKVQFRSVSAMASAPAVDLVDYARTLAARGPAAAAAMLSWPKERACAVLTSVATIAKPLVSSAPVSKARVAAAKATERARSSAVELQASLLAALGPLFRSLAGLPIVVLVASYLWPSAKPQPDIVASAPMDAKETDAAEPLGVDFGSSGDDEAHDDAHTPANETDDDDNDE
eukprot:a845619_30.p1 GENE.a845619_30~~a845619_30.p1  ORF type:complete len:358 (-),score=133.68 a845619_30:16-1041(-)